MLDQLLFISTVTMTSGGGGGRASSSEGRKWSTPLPASVRSKRTVNPIREFVQKDPPRPLPPNKKLIKLSNGDPTTYGNLKPPPAVAEFLASTITKGAADGYSLSMGALGTRKAVSEWASGAMYSYSEKDVYLTAGASGAVECVIGTLANEGDNILVPSPGFPLFTTVAGGYGVETRHYKLDPERSWEASLETIEAAVDSRTRAILINNPSNPCGSVYSEQHCQELAAIASKLQVPIVCDEIYADMIFSGETFIPMASVADAAPVITIGGISKKYVVPGWRLGWILVHDPVDALTEVRDGLRRMTTRMLCPATPMQAAVQYMLGEYDGNREHMDNLMQELEDNAKLMESRLNATPGLRCVHAQGAMYAMVYVDPEQLDFENDYAFAEKLIEEEAVEVLPGRCFAAENFFRIVYAAPASVLSEACDRIADFCSRHRRS